MSEVNLESLSRYIGQTVTIFTTSGGLSGNGFTGVLASIDRHTVKLITDIGAAPGCPIGNTCSCEQRRCCKTRGTSCNWLGSISEIPISRIACFTHNAI